MIQYANSTWASATVILISYVLLIITYRVDTFLQSPIAILYPLAILTSLVAAIYHAAKKHWAKALLQFGVFLVVGMGTFLYMSYCI